MVKIKTIEEKFKIIGLIILVAGFFNSIGYFTNRLELTALLTWLTLLTIWLWALDSELPEKEKYIKEEPPKDIGHMDKTAKTPYSNWFIVVIIVAAILFILASLGYLR